MSAIKMAAKWPGKCAGCGGAIAKGEQILWANGDGARHPRCASSTSAKPAATGYSARVESSRRQWGARRGMGAGHGSAPSVAGYSSYCTDRPGCGCFDCAS